MRRIVLGSLLWLITFLDISATSFEQEGGTAKNATGSAGAGKVTLSQLKTSIELLGSFDFPVRTDAGRTVRRADPEIAVPALRETVTDTNADWYVRYRALVLLSAFNDPRTNELMLKILQEKNDRLRGFAYEWFEHHRDPSVLPRLIGVLDREESEFVRPALTRTLAAYASDTSTARGAESSAAEARKNLNRLVMSGQDLFRAAVIEALGDYRAAYALPAIMEVAKLEGPLQDDAILAIGRIGDKRGLVVLADLQRSAPRPLQPWIAAAICLLGSNCPSHEAYLAETLKFAAKNPGYQELLRAAAGGLAALAIAGSQDAATTLFDHGAPARDPERAPIALGLGTLALRNTALLLQVLEQRRDSAAATELLREAFDMLDEDLEEERFFAAVRRAYWAAPAGSMTRRIADTLIQRLEF